MDIFRAIFQDSDVEEAVDDEEEEHEEILLVPSKKNTTFVPEVEEEERDVSDLLFEMERSARRLEKKEFPIAPPVSVVVGPAKPPPELLAAYALNSSVPEIIDVDSDSSRERNRKKKKLKKESKERKVSLSQNIKTLGLFYEKKMHAKIVTMRIFLVLYFTLIFYIHII